VTDQSMHWFRGNCDKSPSKEESQEKGTESYCDKSPSKEESQEKGIESYCDKLPLKEESQEKGSEGYCDKSHSQIAARSDKKYPTKCDNLP